MSLNSAVLSGTVGKVFTVGETKGGKPWGSFSLNFQSDDRQRNISVTAFGDVVNHLEEGQDVVVSGRLSEWNKKDEATGEWESRAQLTANDVEFVSGVVVNDFVVSGTVFKVFDAKSFNDAPPTVDFILKFADGDREKSVFGNIPSALVDFAEGEQVFVQAQLTEHVWKSGNEYHRKHKLNTFQVVPAGLAGVPEYADVEGLAAVGSDDDSLPF